jgi:Ca-activated chloride channel family protein
LSWTIGERKIRGIIREREEARRIYTEARNQGHVASLLTQERPNIFTQSVANIEPGKQIDINIKYFHTLTYVDGWYEYHFPMVVGPRFNPPGSTDGIGAKARDPAVGASGQSTEISYLTPNDRSGHDISLAVHLDAGVKIEQLQSINHKVQSRQQGGDCL